MRMRWPSTTRPNGFLLVPLVQGFVGIYTWRLGVRLFCPWIGYAQTGNEQQARDFSPIQIRNTRDAAEARGVR